MPGGRGDTPEEWAGILVQEEAAIQVLPSSVMRLWVEDATLVIWQFCNVVSKESVVSVSQVPKCSPLVELL